MTNTTTENSHDGRVRQLLEKLSIEDQVSANMLYSGDMHISSSHDFSKVVPILGPTLVASEPKKGLKHQLPSFVFLLADRFFVSGLLLAISCPKLLFLFSEVEKSPVRQGR
jgi:hypothetical protein